MNFRRILSKTSVNKSSSEASGKCSDPSGEIARLQGEVELLNQTIQSLKISVESRDAAIGTLAREKEKLYVELKSVQRTNRNLHQQLADERDMHSKEKNYLIEEIKRLTKNEKEECGQNQDSLDDVVSNASLKEQLKAKDEVIYTICTKYLKIKISKQQLLQKCQDLERKSQKVCENVICLLRQNKLSLDSLLNQISKASSTPPTCKHYLKLMKMNSSLHFENTELKVRLSLKEFAEEQNEEITIKEQKSHRAKVSKSEGKCDSEQNNQTSNRYPYEKLHKVHDRPNLSKYKRKNTKYSPYFRRKTRFYSDPNLVGGTLNHRT